FSLRRKSPKIKGFEDFVQQRFLLQVQYLHKQNTLSKEEFLKLRRKVDNFGTEFAISVSVCDSQTDSWKTG
ncbi:MAG: hypothetical protein II456_00130, partial [Firmicutes bacterium]|nr:hypothetical protein [Bacillota bacterium]